MLGITLEKRKLRLRSIYSLQVPTTSKWLGWDARPTRLVPEPFLSGFPIYSDALPLAHLVPLLPKEHHCSRLQGSLQPGRQWLGVGQERKGGGEETRRDGERASRRERAGAEQTSQSSVT